MYELLFHTNLENDFKKLDKPIRQRILNKIKWLADNADLIRHEQLTAQWSGFYKLRVGNYRVIYEIFKKENKIIIHAVGHRSKIYKID